MIALAYGLSPVLGLAGLGVITQWGALTSGNSSRLAFALLQCRDLLIYGLAPYLFVELVVATPLLLALPRLAWLARPRLFLAPATGFVMGALGSLVTLIPAKGFVDARGLLEIAGASGLLGLAGGLVFRIVAVRVQGPTTEAMAQGSREG